MNLREWMERHYGARPSTMPLAALAARVRHLQVLLASARKLCVATERWDAVEEAIRRFMRSGQNRPG
ncbi:MAG TPA: hypothetical protein VFI42_15970 [Thermomicrobiaceae bacterium]|nr:hypothetical protein [Thermomicrobiaceae bacterium]